MSRAALGFLLVSYLTNVACLGGRLEENAHSPAHDHEEEFDYTHGGEDWTEHQACSKGKRQSPIDFPFFEEDIMNPVPRDYFTRSKNLGARFLQFVDPIEEEDENEGQKIFEALHVLNFDAEYGEIADVKVENLTDTIKVEIEHIDGKLVMHEDLRADQIFKPV